MYSLRHEARGVSRAKKRLSEPRTSNPSSETVLSLSLTGSALGPLKNRANPIRQACGVVTKAWNVRDTKEMSDNDCGGKWERIWVKTSVIVD